MKILKKICLFIGAFLLYHILFSNFFPVDNNNVLISPDWYTYLGIAISVVVASSGSIKKKWNTKSTITKPVIEPVINPAIMHDVEPTVSERVGPNTNTQPFSALDRIDAMDGHAFEFWCADFLRDNGFSNVSVTKSSGDQGVDVLAEKEGIRYAIQCKCYSHDLSNKPVQEVHAGKTIYHCHIGAVITNRHFTKGAKEAAESTGVLLWDRDWIEEHLKGTEVTQQQSARDSLLWDALELVRAANGATPAIVQNGLGIGYARAARIVDQLEELGYIGPFRGSQPREIIR